MGHRRRVFGCHEVIMSPCALATEAGIILEAIRTKELTELPQN